MRSVLGKAVLSRRSSYKGSPSETARKSQAFGDGPQNYWKPAPSPNPVPSPSHNRSGGVYRGGSTPHPIPTALPRPRRTTA